MQLWRNSCIAVAQTEPKFCRNSLPSLILILQQRSPWLKFSKQSESSFGFFQLLDLFLLNLLVGPFSALAWILFVWAGRVSSLLFVRKKRSRTRRSFNSFISRARRGKRRVREGEWVWAQMLQHSLRLRRPESAEDLRQQLKPRTKQFWMNVSSSPIRHFWEEKTFWGLQKKFWSKLCVKDFSLDDDDDGVDVDDELSIFWRDLLLRKFCCKNYSPRTGPEIFVLRKKVLMPSSTSEVLLLSCRRLFA